VCGLAILSLVIGACTQPTSHVADAGSAPPPIEVVLPRATLPDGATVDLELATTPEETTTGLMFRPSLPVEVVADARPCPAEPCPRFIPDEPSRAVLEMAAGSAVTHGITVGESVAFERVPGYPVPNEELGIRN